eukprot:TRINITY_DN3993_c0_g1_i1.p1 TRINITY_DN3993_c0_g1~~TRINITY_DN3993_c0_g1_i1.p1  ORF type:complete len:408 (+),score=107.29 TRINITY_DN3993_c0_g1_i1:70-1224(+)
MQSESSFTMEIGRVMVPDANDKPDEQYLAALEEEKKSELRDVTREYKEIEEVTAGLQRQLQEMQNTKLEMEEFHTSNIETLSVPKPCLEQSVREILCKQLKKDIDIPGEEPSSPSTPLSTTVLLIHKTKEAVKGSIGPAMNVNKLAEKRSVEQLIQREAEKELVLSKKIHDLEKRKQRLHPDNAPRWKELRATEKIQERKLENLRAEKKTLEDKLAAKQQEIDEEEKVRCEALDGHLSISKDLKIQENEISAELLNLVKNRGIVVEHIAGLQKIQMNHRKTTEELHKTAEDVHGTGRDVFKAFTAALKDESERLRKRCGEWKERDDRLRVLKCPPTPLGAASRSNHDITVETLNTVEQYRELLEKELYNVQFPPLVKMQYPEYC